MAKKCKHCGTVVEDAVAMCPNCQNLAFVEIAKVELSPEQFQELVRSASEKLSKSSSLVWRVTWRVLLALFTILGIPGAIVGWSIWSSMQSFERTTTTNIQTHFTLLSKISSNQIVVAHASISNDVVANFEMYGQEANNKIALAYASVTNQIAEEFQTPRIKQTVESVAKGEAKSILEGEVEPVVTSFRQDVLFIRTVARAQAYDFKAYQRLLEIGRGTNDNAKLASTVLAEIDRSLARERSESSPRRRYMVYSGTNFYGGPFTSDELAVSFSRVTRDQTSFNREGFANTVADLNERLFLPSLMEFFANETDLAVADRLTIAISALAKEDFHPRDFERITSWWKDNHDLYTNWPLATFELGLKEFSSVHYQQAAEAFEQVLNLDSGADMSRAYAIACYWETGQTNRAATLAKEFKSPSARWAQWATAKAELEAGNTSNATVRFFSISTNFWPGLPNQNAHVHRHVDWQLFNGLKETKTP